MSNVDEIKSLITKNNEVFEHIKGRLGELEGKAVSQEDMVAHKTAIDEANKKMTELETNIDKLTKALEAEKVKTKQLADVDKDVTKRKQYVEFFKSIQNVVKTGNSFSTDEMISYKEHMDAVKALPQFNSVQDSAGGLSVLPEIDTNIDALVREYSDLRQWCSAGRTNSDVWKRPFLNKTNGGTWEKNMTDYVSATKTDTLSQISIPINALYSIVPISAELEEDDMIGFVQELLMTMAEDFVITESTSAISGDGSGEMYGITTYADGTAYNQVERYTTAGSNAIAIEDIINLIGKVKTAYKGNSAFYMPREIQTEIRLLRSDSGAGAGTGNLLWQPAVALGQPTTLQGYPVREMAELDNDITVDNAEVCIFGDLRGYKIVDRIGIEVQRDPFTSYPNRLIKARKRVGGGLTKGETMKILKIKA